MFFFKFLEENHFRNSGKEKKRKRKEKKKKKKKKKIYIYIFCAIFFFTRVEARRKLKMAAVICPFFNPFAFFFFSFSNTGDLTPAKMIPEERMI